MNEKVNNEFDDRKELLKEIGNRMESKIIANELIYLSEEDARNIHQNVKANWEVFAEGMKWDIEGEAVEVKPKDAETGNVLNGRALLVLAALGEPQMTEMLINGLTKAMDVKGGGIWKGSEKKLSVEDAIKYAREFISKRCYVKNFSFSKDDGEEQKLILNRLEALINGAYYTLATSALVENNQEDFINVQKDLLLSSNIRLPILKGHERSLEDEKRNKVLGFAQAAPIRHISPGCLGVLTESMISSK